MASLDIDNIGNFNFEDTLKEAKLSLGPRETFPNFVDKKSDAPLILAEASIPGTPAHQEPVHSNNMRAQKRKKTDEVDKGDILPEGSRRNRNKTARARGFDSLA